MSPKVSTGLRSLALGCALAWSPATACVHAPVASVDGEVSLGTPSRGYLRDGVRIADRGPGFELFRTRAQGGEVFGTRRLVAAIERAARYVQRHAPGGAPLRVGDLSGRRGGRLSRHASHRTGRDADVIFYALDPATGASVPAPAFVRYDARGASLDPAFPVVFDAARNWALVEALVRDERAGVLRLFCAERLRVLLLDWARAHGRDGETMARAASVLRQPSDSAPHDDHFHVRVACAPVERALGCQDGGPVWWWLERAWGKPDRTAPADDAALLALLADDPPPPAASPVDLAPNAPEREAHPGARGPALAELRAPLAAVREPRAGAAGQVDARDDPPTDPSTPTRRAP